MAKPWFRLWTEAKNDAKLRALSDSEFRLWFKLLCMAAESDERGIIDYSDAEFVALEVDCSDTQELTAGLKRMERVRLLKVDGERIVFASFDERQYIKESDKPDAVRERKRQQREREKQEQNECHADVTPCHANVTPLQNREREEQNRTDSDKTSNGEEFTKPVDNRPTCFTDMDEHRVRTAYYDKYGKEMPPDVLLALSETCAKRCNGLARCGQAVAAQVISDAKLASKVPEFIRQKRPA